ncbi:MAG: hypothetical protein R3F62_07715 [Planctomycetota bacterium]
MKRFGITAGALVGVLALTLPLMAEPTGDEGTFRLQNGGERVSLWISQTDQGGQRIVRRVEDGSSSPKTERGDARRLSNGILVVEFEGTDGVSGALSGTEAKPGKAAYLVQTNRIYGLYIDGDGVRTNERGWRVAETPAPEEPAPEEPAPEEPTPTDPADPADPTPPISGDLRIDAPVSGNVVLAGSRIPVELTPSNATLEVEGPASASADGLTITGPGAIKLSAKLGNETSAVVELTAIEAQVTRVKVTPFVSLGQDPQFERALGSSEAPSFKQPAVIQQGAALEVEVTLQASASLSAATTVMIEGSAGDVRLSGEAELRDLERGVAVKLTSAAPLNDAVAVNSLDLEWTVAGREAGTSPVRVYTTHATPRKNVRYDRQEPATILHFEKACTWANGASQNIGQGADSIPHAVDNLFRHLVHPEDQAGVEVAVPDYAAGAAKPINYDDLSGRISDTTGERSISSLYYPPLEPKEDYERYEHFRNNFGWWLLENPTHTGGRCNQQAALVASILGTLGIEARIHYLERTGRGKKSGRPMRNYWYAAGGGGPWNFHGICAVTLADGSEHVYDGSFSFPSASYAQWGGRKNGSKEWAENEGGPFIQAFRDDKGEIWYYEDVGGRVSVDDIPDEVVGVPRSETDLRKLADDRAKFANANAVAAAGN